MEQKVYTHPASGIKYFINSHRFVYSLNIPPVFCIVFKVRIPRYEQPDQLMRVKMEIKSFMSYINSQNPGLATYLKSVLESFSGKPQHEMLAFQSLEADGFDINRIIECIMNDANLSFSGDE